MTKRKKKGNVGVIKLKNGSTIYTVTDGTKYKHVRGLSSKILMLNEDEYE